MQGLCIYAERTTVSKSVGYLAGFHLKVPNL